MENKGILKNFIFLGLAIVYLSSCSQNDSAMEYDFDHISDRVWIGEDFWGVPLEDWSVKNSRIEFSGDGQQNTCSYLTGYLNSERGDFGITFDMGLLDMGLNPGASGIIIGSSAPEDESVKAAVYFGRGLNLGISTDGYIFAGQARKKLPENFSYEGFRLRITGKGTDEGNNNRDSTDNGGAEALEKEVDNQNHKKDRLEERVDHLFYREANEVVCIKGDPVVHPFGKPRLHLFKGLADPF